MPCDTQRTLQHVQLRENKLPCPFSSDFGVLPCQRTQHLYLAQTLFEIPLKLAELAGMALVLEWNKTPNPVDVGFFRSMAVVFETNSLSDDIQQHRLF